ncbi:MAG TPA: ribonuclease E, partial [Corynebacterium pollutisoli]|nr:ribonuclease E [Corynebacterium pollutisoli]
GADYVPEKSFQEAVAEFDASPRRRRRTRGNSRSDRRPQREDFPGSVPSGPVAQAEDTMIKVSERPEPEPEQEEGGRRRRRRATRSRAPEQVEQTEPQETQEPQEEKPRSNRPSEVSSGAPTVTRSRGRRRAVRRTTAGVEKPEVPAKQEQGDVEKRGRGRRRVARRTSGR